MDLVELRALQFDRLIARRLAAMFEGRARLARTRNAARERTLAGDAFALDGLERARERFAREEGALHQRLLGCWKNTRATGRRAAAPGPHPGGPD